MPGAWLDSGSPSTSDDESVGGGAPLWPRSPEKAASGEESTWGSPPKPTSAAAREGGDSDDECLGAVPGPAAGGNPQTPPDQATKTPEPSKPRRTGSKSALRGAGAPSGIPTANSVGGAPPVLNLSGYPGPGAAPQRQPSLPVLLAPAPVVGGIPVPMAIPAQQHGHSSLPGSTTQSFINAMQVMNLNAAEEDIHPAQKIQRDQICKIQARIWGLRQGLENQTGVSREFLTTFDYDAQELINNTAIMNKAMDTLAKELKTTVADKDRARGLEATIRDLEGDLKDWKERLQNTEKTLASVTSHSDEHMRTIQFLKEQLRQSEIARTILQDQVQGKRNLWLHVHTDPQERAAALNTLGGLSAPLSGQTGAPPAQPAYAPSVAASGYAAPSFAAPPSVFSGGSHTGSVYSGSSRPGTAAPGHVQPPNHYNGGVGVGVPWPGAHFVGGFTPLRPIPQSHSGPAVYPAQHQRRMSNATVTSDRSKASHANSRFSKSSQSRPASNLRKQARPHLTTDNGSPMERKPQVPHTLVQTDISDAELVGWAEGFQSLFALAYGFCSEYFYNVPQIDTDWKSYLQAANNGEFWKVVTDICRTTQEEEHGDHAVRLFENRDSRAYLMQRVILQHVVSRMFDPKIWKGFSDDNDKELAKLEMDLKTIDPSKTYERQLVIDRRADLVSQMVANANDRGFKNNKVSEHHQHLKAMIAPFLTKRKLANASDEAFYDLHTIMSTAWDQTAKIFSARTTFQFVWADVGVRFAADTHEAVDCSVDRHTVQRERCRVQMCSTPAVTMRDDRGLNIQIKNILKTGVLVMQY